jgi:hypothetical protein
MAYGEARVAALSSSLAALQGKIDHELTLIAPDMAKLANFKRKLNRLKDEIDSHRIKLASVV